MELLRLRTYSNAQSTNFKIKGYKKSCSQKPSHPDLITVGPLYRHLDGKDPTKNVIAPSCTFLGIIPYSIEGFLTHLIHFCTTNV